MRYRKLSSTGDMNFGNGQADFYRDNREAVAQAVQTRLLLWLNEWFLNVDEGTPWLQGVLGKHSSQTRETVLRDRIRNTEGVVNVQSFSAVIDPDTRKYFVSATINTLYGETTIGVQQ